MPPPDDIDMDETDRHAIVEWLSSELQAASVLRRKSGSHSAFRRLTRYEFNYALQDLLGLPWDFAKDLPPEPHSEEGFENSSELLHLSVSQFETYHRLAREALERATVVGERPRTLYWGIAMQDAAEREWPKQAEQLEKTKKELADDPEKLQAELTRLEEEIPSPTRHGVLQSSFPRAARPQRNGSTTEQNTRLPLRKRGTAVSCRTRLRRDPSARSSPEPGPGAGQSTAGRRNDASDREGLARQSGRPRIPKSATVVRLASQQRRSRTAASQR